ncbi:MAG: hypothetical protein K5978_06345 [Campylobacter sp.]|nr:hypothetical protein [Campylobacter sp.]
MKKIIFWIFSVSVLFALDFNRLVLVDENHAEIKQNNRIYILDSYIIPFEQPYYIFVKSKDNKKFELDEVHDMAIEYIKTRGCTSPLKKREDLYMKNNEQTTFIIVVEC